MKNIEIVITLALFCYINLFSQNQFIQNQQSLNPISDGYLNKVNNNNKNNSIKNDLSEIQGSPYEKEEFLQGTAFNKLTKNSGEFYMRYNVFNDVIETKESRLNKKAFDLIKSEDIYVKIGDSRYHYKTYKDENSDIKEGYFILISSRGNNRLYLKKSKKFNPKKETTDPYGSGSKASFKDYTKYYIELEGKLILIPEKRKLFLKEFSNNKELANFLKTEKINLKKKDDLVRLLNYFSAEN